MTVDIDVGYVQGDTVPLRVFLPEKLMDAAGVTFFLSEIPVESGQTLVTGSADITDADAGEVQYQWQGSETDRTGTYGIQWEVEWNDGGLDTYPKGEPDHIYFYAESD